MNSIRIVFHKSLSSYSQSKEREKINKCARICFSVFFSRFLFKFNRSRLLSSFSRVLFTFILQSTMSSTVVYYYVSPFLFSCYLVLFDYKYCYCSSFAFLHLFFSFLYFFLPFSIPLAFALFIVICC